MRLLIINLVISVLLAACGQQAVESGTSSPASVAQASPSVVTESERLTQWFDLRNEEALAMSPMLMTSLGRKDKYDEIDDASEAAEDQQLQWRAQSVEELRAVKGVGEKTAENIIWHLT